MINKKINDTINEKEMELKEIKQINKFKGLIFYLLDSKTLKEAKKIKNILFELRDSFSAVISKIFFDFVLSYFKNLTYYLENPRIELTTNKIENLFQKIFSKHIKRIYRTEKGILSRFKLKLWNWEEENLAM